MPALKVFNGTTWEYLTGGAAILQQDAEPASPTEGDLWIDTDAEGTPSGTSGPLGYIGAASGSLSGFTSASYIDVTNVTVTATIGAGRRIRVDGMINSISSDAGSGNQVQGQLVQDGGAMGGFYADAFIAQNNGSSGGGFRVSTPAAGSHTWKMQVRRISGSNPVTIYDATILVTDIGPV